VSRGAAFRLALALLAFALLVSTPAPGLAADALTLRVDARETGHIRLHVEARPGIELAIRDELTGEQRTVTPKGAEIVLRRFATWSCASRTRRFTATQLGADGTPLTATAEVRTPSCARRLRLVGPRVVRAGRGGAAHIFDRWRIGGVAVRFCVLPPGASERCRPVRVEPGPRERTIRFRAVRPGTYRVTVTTPHQRLRHSMRANPESGRLRILATGDSMIQIIDSFMKQRVGSRGAVVRSDARISTGLSKPSMLDWPAHAEEQATGMQPDATVMFIGANDGFPMEGADCCGAAWIDEYARRARQMMRSYARAGRGRVYWLLLPAARGGFFRELFPAVNTALRHAAAGLDDDVRLIDLEAVFTPGGRYRSSMRIDGKRVRVRQSDGVHLNTAGASLAATLVIRALRGDRMLR
jgi:lysophospholipase L1-like esterase